MSKIQTFKELYTAQAGRVRSLLFHLCGKEALDDLVQEVFARAWKALPQFKGESSIGTWIYRIALNTAFEWHRKRKSESQLKFNEPDHVSHVNLATQVENKDLAEVAISVLTLEQQSVVVLYYYEELQIEEIAQILDVPDGTVKSRLHAAREKLRAFYEQGRNDHET